MDAPPVRISCSDEITGETVLFEMRRISRLERSTATVATTNATKAAAMTGAMYGACAAITPPSERHMTEI